LQVRPADQQTLSKPAARPLPHPDRRLPPPWRASARTASS